MFLLTLYILCSIKPFILVCLVVNLCLRLKCWHLAGTVTLYMQIRSSFGIYLTRSFILSYHLVFILCPSAVFHTSFGIYPVPLSILPGLLHLNWKAELIIPRPIVGTASTGPLETLAGLAHSPENIKGEK